MMLIVRGAPAAAVAAPKMLAPALVELSGNLQRRHSSTGIDHYTKLGTGGRSSFNGVVATVFGGTGFLGRYVINRLCQNGTMVNVPFRGTEWDARHLKLMGDLGQINLIEYDIRDADSVAKCVGHSNTVINLVGAYYDTRNFHMDAANVIGANTIASESKKAGVERFVHVSHLLASGSSECKFMQSKAGGERAVLSHYRDATILRSADLTGHEDKYLNKIAYMRKLPFGVLPLAGGGWDTIKRPVHVADVAQAIVNATMDRDTTGKTYELYGPEAYYLHDVIQYVFNCIQSYTRIFAIPAPVHKAIGFAVEKSTLWIPRYSADWSVRTHLSENIDESALTLEDLGIEPASLNAYGVEVLRRHRHYDTFNETVDNIPSCTPASERQPAGLVASVAS